MFVVGKTYKRRDLHKLCGGQRQGGISTPSRHSFIMLFSGEQGHQYGYRDRWTEEGLFLYTGEGQRGDMTFVRGNRAIRDHAADGKDLHLFKYDRPGYVQYVGQMVCAGFRERRGPDIEGTDRRIIVFELAPISLFDTGGLSYEGEDEETWRESIDTLRERAIASSAIPRGPTEGTRLVQHRSNAVRVYVLRRANGVCEACGQDAPFVTNSGQPYLEPHHIRRLSDGGPDDPRWVIALCPNCHRRAHYGSDKNEFNQQLASIVASKEKQIVTCA